jgi:hypothetical protein
VKRGGDRQATDSAADDQDALGTRHCVLQPWAMEDRIFAPRHHTDFRRSAPAP